MMWEEQINQTHTHEGEHACALVPIRHSTIAYSGALRTGTPDRCTALVSVDGSGLPIVPSVCVDLRLTAKSIRMC